MEVSSPFAKSFDTHTRPREFASPIKNAASSGEIYRLFDVSNGIEQESAVLAFPAPIYYRSSSLAELTAS
jgi:hypothetical protein